ncbi:release factor glutamine methyltransferase [Schistocerca gregaria]|uniref:release factor glutamine methyltransferase n=1 Tax=Schistocerca gregaria TaxID=7010 RepID=UPI00211F075E|nr:release factor glutamine methyltransferase [Schistocerca gregaria]
MYGERAIASLRRGFCRFSARRKTEESASVTVSASRKLVGDRLRSVQSVRDASLESALLVSMAIGKSREHVVLNPSLTLSERQRARLMRLVRLRQEEMPMAYICGVREFWGLEFEVNPSTLIPRPETETLVSAALRLAKRGGKILDLGTGTGCVILSILKELRPCQGVSAPGMDGRVRDDWRGCAVDISKDALNVAKKNAKILGLSDAVQFIHADWTFETGGRAPPRVHPSLGGFDIVVSNPPYLTREDWTRLPKSVADYEPKVALDGSEDGLRAYRALARQVPSVLKANGHLVLEIGSWQEEGVRELFKGAMRHEASIRDPCGRMRCLVFKKMS